MTLRRSRRWILGMGLLLAGMPALVLWLTARPAALDPSLFFPDQAALTLRIGDFEGAWQRHWAGRPDADPGDAVQMVLRALERWDRLVEKEGQLGARARSDLLPRALFNALGRESWVLFGRWNGESILPVEAPGEFGLVVLLPGDSSIKARVGPLLDFFFDDYTIQTHEAGGVTLYEYKNDKIGRSLTFCNWGGWIVASLRRRGPGPLPTVLATAQRRQSVGMAPAETFGSQPGFEATLHTEVFADHLIQFNAQRGKPMSDDSLARLAAWREALDPYGTVRLTQAGPMLLDWDLTLGVMFGRRTADSFAGESLPPDAAPDPALIEWDLAPAGARLFGPLMQGSAVAKQLAKLERWAPGLSALGDPFLKTIPAGEHWGGALLPSQVPLLPGVLLWRDRPPLAPVDQSPVAYWHALEHEGEDAVDRFGGAAVSEAAPPIQAANRQWSAFVAARRRSSGEQSGLLAVRFGAVHDSLMQIPDLLLSKKDRKELNKTRALVAALDLAFGGAALTMETAPDGGFATLALRTGPNRPAVP